MTSRLLSLIGIIVILAIAVALSSNRRWIKLRVVGAAFALQAGIAVLVLYVPAGRHAIQWMATGVGNLLGYAAEGTAFLLRCPSSSFSPR
jgi:CNT family concentrative nucleoside transporter